MAKFDQGGGCPCGLYRECPVDCEHNPCSTHDLCRRLRAMAGRSRLPKDEAALLLEAAKALDRAREAATDADKAARLAQAAASDRAVRLAYATGYTDGQAHARADTDLSALMASRRAQAEKSS